MKIGATICCWLMLASPAVAADLTLQIRDGRVTLDARRVPVREILAEWARVGETQIVNADRVEGPPLTLRLVDVPEREALDMVLHRASGYVAVLRAIDAPGASAFARIYVLAWSATPVVPPAPRLAPPVFVPAPPGVGSAGGEQAPSSSSSAPAGIRGVADAKGEQRPPPTGGQASVPGFVGGSLAPGFLAGSLVPGLVVSQEKEKPGAAAQPAIGDRAK